MKKRVCLLLSTLLVLSFAACGTKVEAAPTVQNTTVPTAETTTAPTTAPTTLPTEPAPVYHSGLKEDGSFDEGTWFIGDSLTCLLITDYLMPNGLIGEAKYTAKYGSQLTAFFDSTKMDPDSSLTCVYSPEFEGMEIDETAVSLGESATAIYLMWGTNFTPDATAMSYVEIVDYLLANCPNATIHLQTVPYGYPKMIAFETINQRIRDAFDYYQEWGEERVFLIDTFTAIGKNNDQGGIHLNHTGNENWYNAIVEHAAENGLSQ